jgi:riboflavin transporter 2
MGRVYYIDILAIFFGIGTWVCVNGLWVELPLLVQALPEGWNLPSYLSIVTQLANIGPISYTILHSFFPKTITEKGTIYLTMTIGSISTILLVFFWDKTTFFFGDTRSTALLGEP